MLKQYKNYCATPDVKVYKIKPNVEIKVDDENILIGMSKDDLLECRYYYDKIINAILIYFSLTGENGKKKYTKRRLASLIGNAFHPVSKLECNKNKFIQYKHKNDVIYNNNIDNLEPKSKATPKLIKKEAKKKKGYTYYISRDAYLVRKMIKGINCFVGLFKTEEEARCAYEAFNMENAERVKLKREAKVQEKMLEKVKEESS